MRLTPYRSGWRTLFAQEASRLRYALGDRLLRVEHVGSTAVEGMEAKPLIDVLAAVESLEEAGGLVPALRGLGYEYRGDGGVAGRIFLAKGPRSRRTHHLSLVEPTGKRWRESLAFRDYLQANPVAAGEYRDLKRELARRFPGDRASYTVGKARFIERVVRSAPANP